MFRYDTLNILGKIIYHSGTHRMTDTGYDPHAPHGSAAPNVNTRSNTAFSSIDNPANQRPEAIGDAIASGAGSGTGQSTEPQFADFTGSYKGYGFLPDTEGNVKQWRSAEGQQLWEKNTGNVWAGTAAYGATPTVAPRGPGGDFDLGSIPLQSEAGLGMSPDEIASLSEQLRTRFSESDINPADFNKRWEGVKTARGQAGDENAVGALGPQEKRQLEEFFQSEVKGKGIWSRTMDIMGRVSAASGYQTEGTAEMLAAPPVSSRLEGGDENVQLQAMYRAAVASGFSPEVLNSLDTFKGIQTEEGGVSSYVTQDVEVTGPGGAPVTPDALDSQAASDEIQRFVSDIAGSWSDEDRARTAIDLSKIGYTYTPPQYDSQGRVEAQGQLRAGDNAAEISSEDRLRLAEAMAKQSDAQNIASQTRTMNIKSQAQMEQLEATQAWKTEERESEQEFKSRQARLDRNFAQGELDQRERERRQQAEFQRDIQYKQMRAEEQANKISKARNTNERLSIDNAKEMSENQLEMQTDMYQDEIASREGMQESEFEHQVEMQSQAHDYNMAAITEQGMQQRQTESQRIQKQGFQDRLIQGQRDAGAMDRLARQISADHISQGRQITSQRAMQSAELSVRRALQHQELGAEMARLRQAGRQNIDQTKIAGYMERQNQAERIRADERAQGRTISSTEALARADRFMQQNMLERRLSAESAQQLVGAEIQMGQIQETGVQERITQMAGQQRAGRQELEQIREGGVQQLAGIEATGEQQRLTQQEGATQGIAAIEAQAEQERQTYQYQLQQQEASEQRQREALGMDTEQTIDAVRTSTQGYSTNMNAALKQAGETGDYESVNTALAAELPPAPPGVVWDSSSGSFQQRGGFQGREISSEAQQWMATAAPAFKARDRAEQAVTQAQKIQMEAQTRRRATEQAQEDFASAMLTSDIDSAEEAAARHEMAKTSALATEQKMQHVQMLFNLLQNPVQLGMAKRHGLLGQIESALGFSMSGVPDSEPGEANLSNWQSMDSEDRAFAMADYIEQGGSPDEFMRMVASAAPAQMRQVQYGVL